MPSLAEIIAEHQFTRDLNPRYLHLLNECATLEDFEPQQVIFNEGDSADHLYLIHSGLIALQTDIPGHDATTVQTLGEGEVLGWSWLIPPYRQHLSAMAVKPVEVVSINATMLKERMEENHDFGYVILLRMGPVMVERLQNTRMRLLEACGLIT